MAEKSDQFLGSSEWISWISIRLLKGVLQNWQKLNNSSVETLRQTFLIREGILTPNELDYDLDIVKETFDVLLETIPWNISIIQTTFMKNRIIVDWK